MLRDDGIKEKTSWIRKGGQEQRGVLPALVLTWFTRLDPAGASRRVRALVETFEQESVTAQAGAHRLSAGAYGNNGEQEAGRWEDGRYARLLERLARPDGGKVDLRWSIADPLSSSAPAASTALVSLSGQSQRSTPGLWEWRLESSSGPPDDHRAAADRAMWAGLLHLIGAWPETTWGAMFYELRSHSPQPPYQDYVDRWAKLLTERHLAALGGTEAVARRCTSLGLVMEPVEGRSAFVVRSYGSD